jgi:hypothetical protein
MKIIMTIGSMLLLASLAHADVFSGEAGVCKSQIIEGEHAYLVSQAKDKAVANCVKSNFNIEDCIAAKSVSEFAIEQMLNCSGIVVKAYIQVGKPVCN